MASFILKNFCMRFIFLVIELINRGHIWCWYKLRTVASCGFCWKLEAFSQCSVWLFHFIECDANVSVDINYLFFMESCCFSSCKNMLVHKLLRYLIGEWSSSMFNFVMWINVACVVHTGWPVKQTNKSLYVYVISYILCTSTYWM